MQALRLPPMGRHENRADEAVLASVEAAGLGAPDLLSRMAAEAATMQMWLLNSPDEDVRGLNRRCLGLIYAAGTDEAMRKGRMECESTARRLDLMREVRGQLHASDGIEGSSGLVEWGLGAVPAGCFDPIALATN